MPARPSIKPSGLRLMPHQHVELDYLLDVDRAFLLSDVGTGKTAPLLMRASAALQRGQSVLWLTQAGLVRQACDESQRWLGIRPGLLGSGAQFRIGSYQEFARSHRDLRCDLVVVDEAAVLGCGQSRTSSRYAALSAALADSSSSVLATATPVSTAHGLDVHALLAAGQAPGLAPRRQFERWVDTESFTNERGYSVEVPTVVREPGVAHLCEVLRGCALRTDVTQLDASLPVVQRTVVDVDLASQDAATYNRVQQQPYLEGHRNRQRASRSIDAIPTAVIEVIRERADRHTHAVAFTDEKDFLEPLLAGMRNLGLPAWQVTGDVSKAQRHRAVQQFNASNRGVLVGTGALEVGLNLQRASLLVTAIASWTPAREAQREGRLRRQGSMHGTVEHVVVRPHASIERVKQARHATKERLAVRLLAAVPTTGP